MNTTVQQMASSARPLMSDGDKLDFQNQKQNIFDENKFDDPLLKQLPHELLECMYNKHKYINMFIQYYIISYTTRCRHCS